MKTLPANEFKTHCLSLLDQVAETGEEIIILKRGKPVARLMPLATVATSPQATLIGTMLATDDLLDPPLPSDAWEVEL